MISREDIKKLSVLARITVSDSEADALAKDAEAILGYVFDVGEVSAAGQGDAHTALHNVFREDGEPTAPGTYTKDILANAPKVEDEYVVVRKVITRE